MNKYQHLIFGGLLVVAAIAIIVWIMRDTDDALQNAADSAPSSPDESVETLNGLSPLNSVVEVAGPNLTYNVPQPGNIAPISSNQDYLTSGQARTAAIDTADWTIGNLMAVGLPASDFVN